MKVIVMVDQGLHTGNLMIVEVDLFYQRVRLKDADQPGGRGAIVTGLKILDRYLAAIDTSGTNIHLKAVLMAFMRIKHASACQTDVADAEFPVIAGLPLPFHEKKHAHHQRMRILTGPIPRAAIYVISCTLRCLRQHEVRP